MKLDIFLLGALSEKPLNLKALVELAEYIKLSKWMDFKREALVEKLEILHDLNLIKSKDGRLPPVEKAYFTSTESGKTFYHAKLKEYLYNTEINVGMLLLFITFSNHFEKNEIIHIIKKRVEGLEISLKNTDKIKEDDFMSKLYNHSLKASNLFCQSELLSLKEFLKYADSNEKWDDFLSF